MFEKLQHDYKKLFGITYEGDNGDVRGDRKRQAISGFFEHWGWEYSVSLTVIDSGLSEDEIYKWNVLRFHNKLSYLKDKGKFEISLNGNK